MLLSVPKFPVNCQSRQIFITFNAVFSTLNFIILSNFTAPTSKCNDRIAIKQSIIIKSSFQVMKMFKQAKGKSFLGTQGQGINSNPKRRANNLYINEKGWVKK